MQNKLRILALGAAVTAMPLFAGSDNGSNPAGADAPGTPLIDYSPFEKLPSWIQLGGQIRGRFEAPSGTTLINSTQQDYYASRIRMDLGIEPTSWLRFSPRRRTPARADTVFRRRRPHSTIPSIFAKATPS